MKNKTMKSPLKYSLTVLSLIIIVPLLSVFILGLTLDKKFSHTRYCHYNQPPQFVWNLINDLKTNALWRKPHLHSARILPTEKGQMAVWEESYVGGDILLWEIVKSEEPLVLQRRLKNSDVKTLWTIQIKALEDKNTCQVVISEEGEISNPLSRFMAKISFGSTYVDQYLMDIAYAYKEKAKILTLEKE